MRRKTIQDITVAEMKKMRESGMTNQEIAASLEISYKSVLRHIGPQPSEYRGTSARWATTKPEHASGAPAAEKPDKPRFAVRVTKETIEHSEDGIDPITATVDMEGYAIGGSGAARGNGRISDDTLRRVRELDAAGHSRSDITRITGISSATLRRYLGRCTRRKMSSRQVQRMRELSEIGWSISRIAREVGCSDKTVSDHLPGYRRMDNLGKEQLCWSCARSAAGKDKQCSWDARLEPVKGWTVDKDGFVVRCPEFEEAKL